MSAELLLQGHEVFHLKMFSEDSLNLELSLEYAHRQLDQILSIESEFDAFVHASWLDINDWASFRHEDIAYPVSASIIKTLVTVGVGRIISIGTCLEYGNIQGMLSEEMTCNPVTGYGRGKLRLLEHLTQLSDVMGVDYTWARLFYVYGDDQPPSTLAGQLRDALVSGQASFPMSGGQQVRDYLSIDEVIKNLVMLVLESGCGIVNVCSGEGITVQNLVNKMLEEWGQKNKISLNLGAFPYRSDEPFIFFGDNSKLQRIRRFGL
jgi:dTDP-6-deoxy-L-talose 4-dehydrogenase (NAD+)